MSKKKIIVLILIVVLVLTGILIYCFTNSNSNKNKEDESLTINSDITIEIDSFKGTVVSKTSDSLAIIPNEGELIRESFVLINTKIFENTLIYVNGEQSNIDSVEVNDKVAVTFNGKILTVTPTVIVADKVEIEK